MIRLLKYPNKRLPGLPWEQIKRSANSSWRWRSWKALDSRDMSGVIGTKKEVVR